MAHINLSLQAPVHGDAAARALSSALWQSCRESLATGFQAVGTAYSKEAKFGEQPCASPPWLSDLRILRATPFHGPLGKNPQRLWQGSQSWNHSVPQRAPV